MPARKKYVFVQDTGAKVIVNITRVEHDGEHAQNVEVMLADEPTGSKVRLWHNGERWIVRYDERALGDHNNFECVDEWQLRNLKEAQAQFTLFCDDTQDEEDA